MKRVVGTAAVAALVVGVVAAAPASAAPVRETVETASLACPALTSPAGTASLFMGYGEEGPELTSAVWHPGDPPEQDKPWFVAWEGTPTLQGSRLHVDVTLTDFGAETTTTGQVDAVLSPNGSSTTVKQRSRFGNTWQVTTTTSTPVTVTGTYRILGVGSFNLSSCVGELLHVASFGTRPATYVENYNEVSVGCEMNSGDEDVLVIAGALTRRGHVTAELSVGVLPRDGGEFAGFWGDGSGILTRRSVTGSLMLQTNTDEDRVDVGTATVSAHLARTDVHQTRETEGRTTTTFRLETMRVTGTVKLPDGRRLQLENCTGNRLTVAYREHSMRPTHRR